MSIEICSLSVNTQVLLNKHEGKQPSGKGDQGIVNPLGLDPWQ
jgi:hypothetical protein